MPKVKKISDNEIHYNCECGKPIKFFTDPTDLKVTKVSKCFDCQHVIKNSNLFDIPEKVPGA